jgi:hypothetical protein
LSEREQRTEDEVLAEQEADAVEDLDVPDDQGEDVAGGAWPKKYTGEA